MDRYRVRMATVADIDVITRQREAMFVDMGEGDEAARAAMTPRFVRWVRPRLEDGTFLAWLAEGGTGEVAAGAAVWLLEWPPGVSGAAPMRAYVLNVYSERAHRRRGLARMLMGEILAWCRARQIETVFLHASEYGRPLYAELGFGGTNEMRLFLETDRGA